MVLTLVSGVAQAYFDLRQFDMQLDIVRYTLQSWEESVRIARARLRQGLIPKLDADQFEAERANAASRAAELKRQMVQKENELNVLLGRNPAQIPRGRALTDQMLPPAVPAGLPSELLRRRPDILQAEQQLTAATARIGVAKAERFPKITLTGLLGLASPQLSALGSGAFGSAGLALAAPLFNAQALGFQQRAAEAQAKQVLAQYQQTILVAFREVEDALVGVDTAREQTEAQESPGRVATIGLTSRRATVSRRTLQLLGCAHGQAESLRRGACAHGDPAPALGVHRPALQGAGRGVVAKRDAPKYRKDTVK